MPFTPEKKKIYEKAYYLANREKKLAYDREYRAKHNETLYAKARARLGKPPKVEKPIVEEKIVMVVVEKPTNIDLSRFYKKPKHYKPLPQMPATIRYDQ